MAEKPNKFETDNETSLEERFAETEEWVKRCEDSVKKNPEDPREFICLARAYIHQLLDLQNNIRVCYEKVLLLDPTQMNSMNYNNLGVCYERLGFVTKTKIAFRKRDELKEKDPQ